MLIIFSGLPGAGKTTIARALAREIAAVHLRIDTIETALLSAGFKGEVNDTGYRIAYAVAEDNLRLGRTVIADSVNPLTITRVAWRNVAALAAVSSVDIEIVCSDQTEHRRRIETRKADIDGHKLPTWAEVAAREYHEWDRPRLVIDTAKETAESAADRIAAALA